MRIFISWSGSRSKKVADYLNSWLLNLPLQGIEPWVSKAGIDPGTRWQNSLSGALEGSDFGILCLTPENQGAPYICFEAGALSKMTDKAYVVPYLIGMKPLELEYPLKQFQAVEADEGGTWDLIKLIHKATGDQTRSVDTIKGVFDKLWADLQQVILDARDEVPTSEHEKAAFDMQAAVQQTQEVVLSLSQRFSQFAQDWATRSLAADIAAARASQSFRLFQTAAGSTEPVVFWEPKSAGSTGPVGAGSNLRMVGHAFRTGQTVVGMSGPTDFTVKVAGVLSGELEHLVEGIKGYFGLFISTDPIVSIIEDTAFVEFHLTQPPSDTHEVLMTLAQESGVQVLSIKRRAV